MIANRSQGPTQCVSCLNQESRQSGTLTQVGCPPGVSQLFTSLGSIKQLFPEGFAGEEGTARSDKEPSVVCRVGEEEPGGPVAPR